MSGAIVEFGFMWRTVAFRALTRRQQFTVRCLPARPWLLNPHSGWVGLTVRRRNRTDLCTVSPDGQVLHWFLSITDDGVKTNRPLSDVVTP